MEAIQNQITPGASFGAPFRLEVEMAEALVARVPSIERVRMVNSGTEATMAAVLLARGATGRSKIVKFEGCYHGHGDSFLIKAESGAATFGVPDSAGVTEGTARDTLTAAFNDLDGVARWFGEHPEAIAAVIVEPVVGNMGVVPPRPTGWCIRQARCRVARWRWLPGSQRCVRSRRRPGSTRRSSVWALGWRPA
jgi:glutamate-1-semialdehyde 2,1-aminomutase